MFQGCKLQVYNHIFGKTVHKLLAGICKPNQVEHMTVFLKPVQYSALTPIMIFFICCFLNYSPAFYYFRAYLAGLGEARGTKCGTRESVPLIKIRWKEETKVIRLSSKTNSIWDALWTEIHSTLAKENNKIRIWFISLNSRALVMHMMQLSGLTIWTQVRKT